jgi:hypothetical protein
MNQTNLRVRCCNPYSLLLRSPYGLGNVCCGHKTGSIRNGLIVLVSKSFELWCLKEIYLYELGQDNGQCNGMLPKPFRFDSIDTF